MPESKAVIISGDAPVKLHPRVIDLAGRKFGKLAVLHGARKLGKPAFVWKCRCECGKETFVNPQSLSRGFTKSCGCYEVESWGKGNKTHGKTGSHIYAVWNSMIQRCTNPAHISYVRYGGLGVSVCERWRTFENFHLDMGEPPKGWTIERLNGKDGYCPENCCWATAKAQANNTSRNVRLTIDGITRTMSEWADLSGVDVATVWYRVNAGWDHKRAVFTSPRRG